MSWSSGVGSAAAAAAQAASQPLDSDLTAIAALSTTAYGRALLALADLAALKAVLGLRAGTATLVLGTKDVTLASVTADSVIMLTPQSLGTVAAPTVVAVTARTPGVGFTITSAAPTDTSVIGYTIVEP